MFSPWFVRDAAHICWSALPVYNVLDEACLYEPACQLVRINVAVVFSGSDRSAVDR